jgi:hypothetical protein
VVNLVEVKKVVDSMVVDQMVVVVTKVDQKVMVTLEMVV